MEESFLIVGAGEVGLAVLNSLYTYQEKHNIALKVGVLVQPQASSIARVKENTSFKNIQVESLDLLNESHENLVAVFEKYDTVICCSGFAQGMGMQVKITEAVLAAGVKRYIPWQFGVDYDKIGYGSAQPSFDEQLAVRDLLSVQQQTNWIIVSTGMITSFLFREDFGVISLASHKFNALGSYQHKLTLTACEDIGKLTVEVLFHEPAIENQVVYIAGATLTFEEIFNQLEDILATKFERNVWDIPYLTQQIQDNPDHVFSRYHLVFTDPGVHWPMSQTFNFRNNIATTDLTNWAKSNLV